MRRIFKKGLGLLCTVNLLLWSPLGHTAGTEDAQTGQPEYREASKEQALKDAERIGARILVTMSDGTQKTLKDLITAGQQFQELIFHIPEYKLHLRMKAKPAKDHVVLVFQVLDATGHETDRMTQVRIDPTTDQAALFGRLKDSVRVLSATSETTQKMQSTDRSRWPAALCGTYQTRGEQLRNLFFDITLFGTGILLAGVATGPEYAALKLPVLLFGTSLALYGLRLIHLDLLPPCPLS